MKTQKGYKEVVNRRMTDNIKPQKREKRTNKDLQKLHRKLKIEQHEPYQKPGVNSGAPEE